MDFTLNENQQLLRDGAERFFSERYDFESRRKRLFGATGTDRAMWQQFGDMGWLGLIVPEAQGGLGWNMVDAAVILGECGKALVAEPFLEGGIVSVAMLAECDPARVAGVLEQIAGGTLVVVPALMEPGKRYDFMAPVTTASGDGDGYLLTGEKILVAGGDIADQFIVSAALPEGIALFMVDADTEGLTRRSYRQLDGSWASDITFENVQVGSDALIGAGDALNRGLDAGAIGIAAQLVGSLDRILELTAEYLHVRKQFGQSLADFQALQQIMADLFINTEMARSAMHSGLAAVHRSGRDRASAISAARARCDRASLTVGNMGVYLHGGMGMTMEYPVGHHYRRLVQLTRAYGDTEYHLSRYEDVAFEAI